MALCWLSFFHALLLGASNFVAKHSSFFVFLFFFRYSGVYFLSFDKNVTQDFPTIGFIKKSGSFLTGGGKTRAHFWILQKLGFKTIFCLVLLKDPLFTFGKRSGRIQTKQVFTIRFTWFCLLNVTFLHQFPNKCYFSNSPRQKQWLYPFKWFFSPPKNDLLNTAVRAAFRHVDLWTSNGLPENTTKAFFLCQQTSA